MYHFWLYSFSMLPTECNQALHMTHSSMAYIILERKTRVLYDTEIWGIYQAGGKSKFMLILYTNIMNRKLCSNSTAEMELERDCMRKKDNTHLRQTLSMEDPTAFETTTQGSIMPLQGIIWENTTSFWQSVWEKIYYWWKDSMSTTFVFYQKLAGLTV